MIGRLNYLAAALALCLCFCAAARAQLSTTAVTGTVYDGAGNPVAGVTLTIHKVVKNGATVSTQSVTTSASNSSGVITFSVARGSTACISGKIVGLEPEKYPTGKCLAIPDAATANLADLIPASTLSANGLVTQSTLDAHAAVKGSSSLPGHLQCGAGTTCTNGVITVTAGAAALDDLTDVAITSPAANQVPVFNGSLWVNRPLTKNDVGLGNLDNTSDASKPVSTAQQAAIDSASTADRARSNHTGTQTLSTISDAGTAAALNAPASGDAASGEVVKGNDSRLTNARTPTAHASTHAAAGSDPVTLSESQITNLVSDLAGKAASSHTHAESDVTNLTTDLAGKQPLDSDLTAIAGLSPSANDVIQFISGAWANRTTAQLKASLSLTSSDVGLGSVTNDAQLKIASNLSDLNNAGTARTNLGLGTGNSPTFTGLTLTGLTSGRIPLLTTGGQFTDNANLTYTSYGSINIGGTLTANDPAISVARTWNNSGVTFTGIKFAVTDTASAAASLLMDLQVGGTSKFSVDKAGKLTLAPASGFNFSNSTGTGIYSRTTAAVTIKDTFDILEVTNGRVSMRSDVVFRFGLSSSAGLSFSLCATNTFCIGDGGANANANGRVQANLGVQLGTTTAKGTCDSSARGTFYTEFGGTGVADKTYQCLKSAADTYSWVQIVSAP